MADVAIVTANLGGHDEPHPQVEQTVPVDWWYITDWGAADPGPPWRRLDTIANEPIDPRLAAKRYRMPPFDGLPDYRWVIWVDAAAEITNPNFVAEAIEAAGDAPLTTWKHPRRDCIYDEAVMSLREAPDKYGPELLAQVQAYHDEGYPQHHGLYATGTLVWNMDERSSDGEGWRLPARTLGVAWLREIERTTVQDQLSLPVVAWRLGIDINVFPISQVLSARLLNRAVTLPGWKPPPRRHKDGNVYRVARNRWMIFHPHTRRD